MQNINNESLFSPVHSNNKKKKNTHKNNSKNKTVVKNQLKSLMYLLRDETAKPVSFVNLVIFSCLCYLSCLEGDIRIVSKYRSQETGLSWFLPYISL